MQQKVQNSPSFGSLIIRKIPQDLQRAFKSRCAADGISQQDKIIELMKKYTDKQGE